VDRPRIAKCYIANDSCTCEYFKIYTSSVFMVRTIKHHIWKLHALVQPSEHQPSGSGHSKPYFGNYVQSKCNHPDTRATSSRRGLVMEAFNAFFKKAVAVDLPDTRSSRLDTLEYFDHNILVKYRIGTKLASLES
jgi:hypothetical protein